MSKKSELQQLHSRAGELFKTRRYKESLKLIEQLLTNYPNNIHLQYQKGLCHAKLGQVEAARKVLKRLPSSIGAARIARLNRLIQELTDDSLPPAPAPHQEENEEDSYPALPPLPEHPNERAKPAAKPAARPAIDEDDDVFEDATPFMRPPLNDARGGPGAKCSSCGAAIDPGDMICIDCGHVI